MPSSCALVSCARALSSPPRAALRPQLAKGRARGRGTEAAGVGTQTTPIKTTSSAVLTVSMVTATGGGGVVRRSVMVAVVAGVVELLPSCHLSHGENLANPTVGIRPSLILPGSVRVPARSQPSFGRNPPNPAFGVDRIGLMKGTPRIAFMVTHVEVVSSSVRASIHLASSRLLPFQSPVT